MSDIFLAKSMGINGFQKPLVIKKLLPQFSSKPRFVQRFINEAHTLSQLNHSNIVQIIDMGMIGSEYYIVLEYIEGRNVAHLLSKAVKSGQLPSTSFALHLILEVAQGLSYAHRKRGVNGESLLLVHQDINSFNVMVSYEAEVKIIDFGIARLFLDNAHPETLPVAGKLLYFSPEQLQRKPLDRRVDVYGTGVLLYELLTGERLIQHQETVGKTVQTILEMDIASKIAGDDRIHEALKPILIKSIALDPDSRYPWMEDLVNAIRAVQSHVAHSAAIEAHSKYIKELFPREIALDRKRMRKLISGETLKTLRKTQNHTATIQSGHISILEQILLLNAELPASHENEAKKEALFKERSYASGQFIFRQGDIGQEVFLIRSGSVDIRLKAGKFRQKICTLKPGDFFGETAVLGESIRNVSARAAEQCTVIGIDRDTFVSLMNADVNRVLVTNLIRKLRDCYFLLESISSNDLLTRLIYGLLFFQMKSARGKSIKLVDLTDFFGLSQSEELKKYIEKLQSLEVIRADGDKIQILNTDKLNEILNILSGRGKFSFKI